MRSIGGVWFAAGSDRALLLAQMSANGLDYAAGSAALAAVHSSFAAASTGAAPARLTVSGPAVFAHDAAQSIRADVRLLSTLSSVLVAALLFWRFRSLWVVVVIAIPLLLGAAAGALAVQTGFRFRARHHGGFRHDHVGRDGGLSRAAHRPPQTRRSCVRHHTPHRARLHPCRADSPHLA